MRRFRIIFFVIYGAFHGLLLFFGFHANYLYKSNNIKDLLSLSRAIPMSRWVAIFGIILFFINIVMFLYLMNKKSRRINFLEQERNDYKAKMFDLNAEREEDKPEE
jgi:hypothetical protein